MKLLVLLIFLSGCASCKDIYKTGYDQGFEDSFNSEDEEEQLTQQGVEYGREKALLEVRGIVFKQVELYMDLCMESSSGYEQMKPEDAHFEGVKCASQTIVWGIDGLMGWTLKDDNFEEFK